MRSLTPCVMRSLTPCVMRSLAPCVMRSLAPCVMRSQARSRSLAIYRLENDDGLDKSILEVELNAARLVAKAREFPVNQENFVGLKTVDICPRLSLSEDHLAIPVFSDDIV